MKIKLDVGRVLVVRRPALMGRVLLVLSLESTAALIRRTFRSWCD
jgi:hypothetical protein